MPINVRDFSEFSPDFSLTLTPSLKMAPLGATVRGMNIAATNVRHTLSNVGRLGLDAASPTWRQFNAQSQSLSCYLVTRFLTRRDLCMTARNLFSVPRLGRSYGIMAAQRLGFGISSGISRNQLAMAEESANRNPGNASMQNTFYQLLLRYNMPGLIIERYQSGRFANNAATHDVYAKARESLKNGTNMAAGSSNLSKGQWPSLDRGYGGAPPLSVTGPSVSPMGGKGEPVHVIVQESTRSHIFRWVKFFAIYSLFIYLCFVGVTILIEYLGPVHRASAKTDSEVKAEKQTAKLSDVHGCNEAKEELLEVVDFLRNPDKFSNLGAKLPKGVLLIGPPGTGKTLLARAVAGEAGVPFFYMSGSEFDEIFVGVGAKRVRELFAAAKAKAPAIVFIDELDAVGGRRSARDQAYAKQTLNQLLTELDGFDQDTKIVIMGATNLPSLLDKALVRPGRFDRHIEVQLPDVRGRLAILQHHARKLKCAPDVDFESVASRTPGRSGAELENLLNVAALRASRAKADEVSKSDLEWAYDRVTMGSERRSMIVTEKEKEMTAYHEAGHALAQIFDKDSCTKLYKVTILPKGPTLGHTANVPKMDQYSYTAAEYMAQIRILLAGKMAEEMRYGDDKVTSGVVSDLSRATDLSFSMVSNFGMSSELGPVEFGRRFQHLSPQTRSTIEAEVQKTLKRSYEEVRKLLTEKRKELDLLAKALVEYETLDRKEVEEVIRGGQLTGRPRAAKGPMVLPVPEAADEPTDLREIPPPQPQPHPHPQTPPSAAPPAQAEPPGAGGQDN